MVKPALRSADSRYDSLRGRFAALGQEHVFAFWDRLDEAGRDRLLAQAEDLAPRLEGLVRAQERAVAALSHPPQGRPEPVSPIPLPERGGDRTQRAAAGRRGETLLGAGRVAALVVAGGQGTRLGYPGPKGCFPVGPVSDRTLYELHAQKIAGLARRSGRSVPWYVMTSPATDAETRELFERRRCFGLPPEDVFVFVQEMLPAFDFQGRLVLAAPDRIFESPGGHGGSLTALASSGALDDMKRRGVDTIFYYQVDNPLVKVADPVYLGLHAEACAEMSCKVLRKRDPEARWGVLARIDGRVGIVEYTELDDELRYARDPSGELVFWAGNPAIHLLSVPFAGRVAENADELLPFHASAKPIPTLDAAGRPVAPAQANGYKLERFVFDALPAAERVCLVEASVEEEFSPIKNADGEESPASARRDLVAQYRRWLAAGGLALPPEDCWIEIDHSRIDGPEDVAAAGLHSLDEARDFVRVAPGKPS
jgi:UDP-N-acetylglucosamine/UDP-N-acetylgalactosamine diphosphorylase